MKRPFLTTTDIARLTGYTPAQIWNFARKNEIDAGERANPGRTHYRFYDTPELRAWCAEKKRIHADAGRPIRHPPGQNFFSWAALFLTRFKGESKKLLERRPIEDWPKAELGEFVTTIEPLVSEMHSWLHEIKKGAATEKKK